MLEGVYPKHFKQVERSSTAGKMILLLSQQKHEVYKRTATLGHKCGRLSLLTKCRNATRANSQVFESKVSNERANSNKKQ